MPDIISDAVRQQHEAAARHCLTRVVEIDLDPVRVDLDADLAGEYGVSSLHKVLFLTSVCEDTGVDVGAFTEDDVARIRTLRDAVDLLGQRHPGQDR
jgi:hypothetical protein